MENECEVSSSQPSHIMKQWVEAWDNDPQQGRQPLGEDGVGTPVDSSNNVQLQDGQHLGEDGAGTPVDSSNTSVPDHWMKKHISSLVLAEAERELKSSLELQKYRRSLKKMKRKQEKDMNPPRRALSAYNIFVQETIKRKREEGSKDSHSVMFAHVGKYWSINDWSGL